MGFMGPATRAELAQFEPVGIVTPVLLAGVRAFAALGAREVDDDAIAFAFCHVSAPGLIR